MSDNEKFIKAVGTLANIDMISSGVLASLTTAQAILESGWGESGLATVGKALFGIKATLSWKGKVYNSKTKECYDKKTFVTITASFRAYNSWKDSIADHSNFLKKHSRYKNVIGEKDYKKACYAIAKAGYATDPGYAVKLISLIERYKLYEYDKGKKIVRIAKPTLYRLSSGSEVSILQCNLNSVLKNDLKKQLKVDGKFGDLTKSALKLFQKKYKLSVDGIYGKHSAKQMNKILNG